VERLKGKIAVITGGAGGIGAAVAEAFVRESATVMLVDFDEAALQQVVESIGQDTLSYVVADVTQAKQVENYADVAAKRYGGIDIFINNAGVEGKLSPIVDYPVAEFDRVMATNVRGVWLGLKYVIPVMKDHGGSIVITSSTTGIKGYSGFSAYVASKHAVIGLMRTAALECSDAGIRVNCVNPASIETRMMRSLEQQLEQKGASDPKQKFAAVVPMRRYGTPAEVAALMLFLASDESRFCTGGVYMVDGGVSAC